MKGWSEKNIGEICDSGGGAVQTGPFGSQLHQSDYQEHGFPVVMPTNIVNGKIDTTQIARVSESNADRLSRHKLSTGDIVYGRRGDIGRQAYVRKENEGWLCGTGCLRITLGDSEVLPEYLHRYLSISDVVGWIQNQAVGATMPNLNTGILRRVPVFFPKRETQKKIAAVLSAYDDLIENNKRRIALLEKMAEEIYREWFVRMRFPGYKETKFEKGLPVGWEIKKIGEITHYYIGGGWGEENHSTTYSEGAFVIRGTDIPKLDAGNLVNGVYRFHKPSNLKSRKLEANDFIFEVSGGSKDQLLGRNIMITQKLLAYFENNAMCASFCKLIRFNQELVSPFFMKFFLRFYYECDLVGIYQVQSTGISNYQFESFLSNQTLAIPPKSLQFAFDKIVQPILNRKDDLALAISGLTETRDLLLSRLISGKLSVENLDIKFPPGMQEDSKREKTA
jgi:type I restriction enzyme S subunit